METSSDEPSMEASSPDAAASDDESIETMQGQPVWWLVPGMASLVVFAWLLTLVDVSHAGRAYAAYGGIYIAASLLWLWTMEGARPDRWDLIGAAICVAGAALILYGPRPLPS